MRIAILGSVALPVPPPAQGGTELIAYYQAVGLSKKGYKVLLVAASGTKDQFKIWGGDNDNLEIIEVGGGNTVDGSNKEFKLDLMTMEASRKLRMEMVALANASRVLSERKEDYDIILNNMRGEAVFLELAKTLRKPFINVCHLNIFPELAGLFQEYSTYVITISDAQRKNFPNLNYLATVNNCVDIVKYSFSPKDNGYLLMVGTIGKHKNQKAAIEVAKHLGMDLVLAGKIRDQDYYEELKKDIDGVHIQWVGELGFDHKLKLYQGAKAFLFPITWEEPFGLVMIEAMACGVPIVAFNHGAVGEVVNDGKTGFIVSNEEEMMEKISEIGKIKREDCRKWVEEKFTVEKMVDGYEEAFKKLIL